VSRSDRGAIEAREAVGAVAASVNARSWSAKVEREAGKPQVRVKTLHGDAIVDGRGRNVSKITRNEVKKAQEMEEAPRERRRGCEGWRGDYIPGLS
jgi:hypothetical protein